MHFFARSDSVEMCHDPLQCLQTTAKNTNNEYKHDPSCTCFSARLATNRAEQLLHVRVTKCGWRLVVAKLAVSGSVQTNKGIKWVW